MPPKRSLSDYVIWLFAFGYFACYAPYSALTKALSKGLVSGMSGPIAGFALLPISTLASMIGMFVLLSAIGWFKHANQVRVFGVSLPRPSLWTFFSGVCTAAIVLTTTLAYTFKGVSIVFMMLLMRGGVLVLAPLVDAVSGRHVRWFSWVGLGLSLAALADTFFGKADFELTLVASIDVAVYLFAYFVRLRFMSRMAKGEQNANVRFFVEEQMVATPVAFSTLVLVALFGAGPIAAEIRSGFVDVPSSGVLGTVIVIGLLSQGTGVFGGLILLDKRENTYCVPVNRASSILAGVVAAYGLSLAYDQKPPGLSELIGAGLIVAAILVLTLAPMLEKRRARAADRSAMGKTPPEASGVAAATVVPPPAAPHPLPVPRGGGADAA
jgi:hypothetical protein